jgi:hypothetical protein
LSAISYHGVFAPNSAERASVTPAKRGKVPGCKGRQPRNEDTPTRCRTSMTWSQGLKRVFGIDIETCAVCGGTLQIIACIEDPVVIEKILAHVAGKDARASPEELPSCQALTQTSLF